MNEQQLQDIVRKISQFFVQSNQSTHHEESMGPSVEASSLVADLARSLSSECDSSAEDVLQEAIEEIEG